MFYAVMAKFHTYNGGLLFERGIEKTLFWTDISTVILVNASCSNVFLISHLKDVGSCYQPH